MRRLLIYLSISTVAVSAATWQSSADANHSVYPVYAYVFHPTGNGTHNAELRCGWHDLCDGYYNDATKIGLDWGYPGNVSYTVYYRLRLYGGSSSSDWVGRAQTVNSTSGCYRRWTDLYRVNWSYIGTITNQHVHHGGTVYANLYGSGFPTAGYNNEGAIASMIQSGDNCQTTGPHTMQWYTNSSGGNIIKNTSTLPFESGCDECNTPYNRWATYEWRVSFNTQP
jgi:hypothetical protein